MMSDVELHIRDMQRALEYQDRFLPPEYRNAYQRAACERLPLPFDPSMMDDFLLIPKSMRVRRIALWWSHGCLSQQQLNQLLASEWTDGGWPADMKLGTRRLVRMFRDAGFVTDTEGVVPPTEPMTLYRGAGVHNVRGLAWSTNEEVAIWFARRLHRFMPETYPCLYTVTMPPHHILGRFLDRDEDEVIVNALALRCRVDFGDGVHVEKLPPR